METRISYIKVLNLFFLAAGCGLWTVDTHKTNEKNKKTTKQKLHAQNDNNY